MPLLTTTEQQIALRERRLHELFEFTPDAIVMSDSSGTIRETNRQAEVVFGYDPEGLIGQQVEVLMPYPSSGPTVTPPSITARASLSFSAITAPARLRA